MSTSSLRRSSRRQNCSGGNASGSLANPAQVRRGASGTWTFGRFGRSRSVQRSAARERIGQLDDWTIGRFGRLRGSAEGWPEIARARGLLALETKTPIYMDRRFVKDVLGGPGRNRTTDTRIFKTSLAVVGKHFIRRPGTLLGTHEPEAGPHSKLLSEPMQTLAGGHDSRKPISMQFICAIERGNCRLGTGIGPEMVA